MQAISRRDFLTIMAAGIVGMATRGCDAEAASRGALHSVTGEVSGSLKGVVLPHEHIMVDFVGADKVDSKRYDADAVYASALPHLQRAKALGCGILMECTPAFLGRDVRLLKRLSKASGLAVLTCTGLYGAAEDKYLPRYAFTETAEQLAKRWSNEWTSGIDGSGIRPGFIKIGVDPDPSEVDMKLVRAAGLTHRATGLAIASHTVTGAAAVKEVELLRKLGVDPSAFIWVHAHAEADKVIHVQVARDGAWVSFDGLSPESVDQHVRLAANLRDHGLLHRVLVSHDAGWYHVGEPGGGTFRPFDTLFKEFIPALRKAGFTQSEVKQLTQDNPRKAFARGRVKRRDRGGLGAYRAGSGDPRRAGRFRALSATC